MSKPAVQSRTITVGHSPDPDDAFMFYALTHGKVEVDGIQVRHHLEDIQSLNRRALRGEFEVTAISAAAYPSVAERYWIMAAGASVGRGYGPILVAKQGCAAERLTGARIAIPGKQTTAFLTLQLWSDDFTPVFIPFDQIIPAVVRGDVDAGLLIHEGQITYRQHGLEKILDLGQWWQEETGLPLPLGLDVVRADVGETLASSLNRALRESIAYAHAHQEEALAYALEYGRGIQRNVGDLFVKMYVNDDTLDLGDEGRRALELLYCRAAKKRLLAAPKTLHIIDERAHG